MPFPCRALLAMDGMIPPISHYFPRRHGLEERCGPVHIGKWPRGVRRAADAPLVSTEWNRTL